MQSISGITPDQIYKLGAEALGWNNSTAAGKALIAEDLKLLRRFLPRFKQVLSSPFDLGQEALTQTWDGHKLSV